MNELWDELSYRPPKPPPRKKRGTPKRDLEGAVVKECLKWLYDHPRVMYVERRNTGSVQFTDGGFLSFGSKGAADIWCIIRSPTMYKMIDPKNPDAEPVWLRPEGFWTRHVEIECKRRHGGILSLDQVDFQRLCGNIMVPYLVVHSAKDLAKQLKELNLTD